MKFEWNATKARSNLEKHKVYFEDASTVFGDPLSITIDDLQHSSQEDRLITIGCSANMKVLVIVHVDTFDTVRIISARKATKHERRQYEEIK
jgi:uncharacterized protein